MQSKEFIKKQIKSFVSITNPEDMGTIEVPTLSDLCVAYLEYTPGSTHGADRVGTSMVPISSC